MMSQDIPYAQTDAAWPRRFTARNEEGCGVIGHAIRSSLNLVILVSPS